MKPSSLLRLLADTLDNGGGTFQLNGEAYKPTAGYAVSLKDGGLKWELKHHNEAWIMQDIAMAMLSPHPLATHLGTWISEGVLYFDYVVIVGTEQEARALSLANNQQAFYSFASGEVIPTVLNTEVRQ